MGKRESIFKSQASKVVLASALLFTGVTSVEVMNPNIGSTAEASSSLRYGSVLQYGSKGSHVTSWQKDMNQLGFKLAVDGSFGPDARKKTKQFQKKYNLTQDGYFGPASQRKMNHLITGSKPNKKPNNKPNKKPSNGTSTGGLLYGKVLLYGTKGSAVSNWQKDMNQLGFTLAVDGSYGPDARNKAKQFQRKYGLVQDGHFGPASQNKMKSVLKKGGNQKPTDNNESSVTKKPTYVKGVLMASKQYPLPSTYNPGESKEARTNFNELARAAKSSQGYNFTAFSTFRTYKYQKGLFDGYVRDMGYKKASQISAVPGHSEHQTGLAFDIGVVGKEGQWLKASFGKTAEGKWLAKNAHKHGFIVRYPKGKESITGYAYEPWHLRYLGKDLATKVYQSGKTLEEYLGIK